MEKHLLAKRLARKAKNKAVAIVMLLVLVFISSIFISQTHQLAGEAAQIKNIDQQISDAQKKNNDLMAQQQLTATDAYKEDIARTRDGLVLPNEVIFVDSLASNQ